MARHVLTGIAVAGLLAGVLWFALSAETVDIPVGSPEGTPLVEARNPAGPSIRVEMPVAEGSSGSVAPVEAPVGDGMVVEVVEQINHAPVAGADVFYLEPEDLPPERQSRAESLPDFGPLIRRYGRHFRTGVDGTTSVPRGERSTETYLYGEAGNAKGLGTLRGVVDDRFRLVIGPPLQLDVQVTNAQGLPEPAVAVALAYRQPDRPWRLLLRAQSREPDALVNFELMPGFVDQAPSGSELAVALWAPLGELVHRTLDLDNLPDTPIVLVLPPVGTVEVHVFDAAGVRTPSSGSVTLARSRSRSRPGFEIRFGPEHVRNGVATFAHVGLGLLLDASVSLAHWNYPMSASGPGPTVDGERGILRVQETVRRPIFSLRILDPEGRPVSETPLRLSFDRLSSSGMVSRGTSMVTSDARGMIRIDASTASFQRQILWVSRTHAGQRFDPSASGRVNLDRAFPPGLTHLGDLRLTPAPLLARGRVVDSGGEPVAGAQILVTDMVPDPDRPRGFRYQTKNEAESQTNREGEFRIHGRVEGSAVRVQAIKRGYVRPDFLEPAVGTTGLEIRMQRAGSIVATFNPESAGILSQVRTTLVSPSDAQPVTRGLELRRQPARRGDTMTWNDLLPGTYDLTLSLDVVPEPLLQIDGIVVEPAEVTRDPRTQEIDLSSSFLEVDITVRDQLSGLPLPDVEVQRRSGDSWRLSRTDAQGHLILAVPPWGTEVRVSAPGYLSESRDLVVSDHVFHLRSGPTVRIEVEGIPTDLGEGADVQLLLAPEGRSVGGTELTPDEPTSLPALGTHLVRWRARVRGRVEVLPDADPPHTVEIDDTPELQRIQIAFPQDRDAEIRARIRELRDRRG